MYWNKGQWLFSWNQNSKTSHSFERSLIMDGSWWNSTGHHCLHREELQYLKHQWMTHGWMAHFQDLWLLKMQPCYICKCSLWEHSILRSLHYQSSSKYIIESSLKRLRSLFAVCPHFRLGCMIHVVHFYFLPCTPYNDIIKDHLRIIRIVSLLGFWKGTNRHIGRKCSWR